MHDWGDNIFDSLVITPPLSPNRSANEGRTIYQYRQSSKRRHLEEALTESYSAGTRGSSFSSRPRKSSKRYMESPPQSSCTDHSARKRPTSANHAGSSRPSGTSAAAPEKKIRIRRIVKCRHCNATMRCDNRNRHLENSHTGQMPVTCVKCNARCSNRRRSLGKHNKRTHGSGDMSQTGSARPSKLFFLSRQLFEAERS